MKKRFDETNAPFVPTEASFNEIIIRDSTSKKNPNNKKAGGLLALLKNDKAVPSDPKLTFDENHFNKFLK